MTTPSTPSSPPPASDPKFVVVDDKVAVAPSFEYQLHQFWKKNGKIVLVACVVILLAIAARGVWELYQGQQENGIEAEYAAANSPEKLKAFASAHAGHSLAGIAYLRMADDDYAAAKYADAVTSYEKSAAILKTGPFAARSQLGAAMAKIGSGKTSEGEATLKQISGDASQLKALRAEAAYHLTSLASEAGRSEDVVKYADLIAQLDPNSFWQQRAMMLRAALPPSAMSAVTPAKVDAAAPGVQVKVPGKE